MRKAYIVGNRQITVDTEPMPTPRENSLLIRVLACGICGSDKAFFRTSVGPCKLPFGHEILGEIVAVGSDVESQWADIKYVAARSSRPCGTCINCQRNLAQYCLTPIECKIQGFAEYVCIDANFLLPIRGEDVDETYLLVEPLNVALSLLKESQLLSGQRVLVSGAGAIGLLTAWMLHSLDYDLTIVVRSTQSKATEWLKSSGIKSVVWEELAPYVESFDSVIATTPYSTLSALIPLLRRGGRLVFNGFDGDINSMHQLNLSLIHRQSIQLKGVYSRPQIYMEQALELVRERKAELSGLITDRFPLEEINQAFEKASASSSDYDTVKVVIVNS